MMVYLRVNSTEADKPEVMPVDHKARALQTSGHPHDEERRDAGRVLHEVEVGLRRAEEQKEEELEHLGEIAAPHPTWKSTLKGAYKRNSFRGRRLKGLLLMRYLWIFSLDSTSSQHRFPS